MKACVQCGEIKSLTKFKSLRNHAVSAGCLECIQDLMSPVPRMTVRERFEQYVMPLPWSGCFIWIGGTSSDHGIFNMKTDGKHWPTPAYRAAWEIYNGPISDGLSVCHTCDDRLCVNLDHLFLATHRENMHDMMRKKRGYVGFGSDHKYSKFTEAQIIEMRASDEPLATLAEKYDTSISYISNIRNGHAWKHVGGIHGR